MVARAFSVCRHAGCGALIAVSGLCAKHERERQAQYDKERGSAASRGYGRQWQLAREGYLRRHPLCVTCKDAGRAVPATVVDHIRPHRGDKVLFWDSSNWQAVCKRCHDSKTAREDGRWGGAV